jgi:hypothetical protein
MNLGCTQFSYPGVTSLLLVTSPMKLLFLTQYLLILLIFFLSLAPQPSLGHGLLHKIQLNFLEASQQFSLLQDRVVSPTPNPHPEGPGLCIYIPQRQGGTHFSRLLRHAWVTLGLFLFAGHHTGKYLLMIQTKL